jgi:hypothetical protein
MNNTQAYRCVLEAAKQRLGSANVVLAMGLSCEQTTKLKTAIRRVESRVLRMEARLAHVRAKLAKKKNRPACLR